MKRVIRLTESDLARIVKRVINEGVVNEGVVNVSFPIYHQPAATDRKYSLVVTNLKKVDPKVVAWSGKSSSGNAPTKDSYGQFFCGTNKINIDRELNTMSYVDKKTQVMLQSYCK
jgi:hypothetical protein